MAERDDDRFRPKLGRLQSKGDPSAKRFTSHVLKAINSAGVSRSVRSTHPKLTRASQFYRGAAAAQSLKQTPSARDRRVLIKSRLVNLKKAGHRSTQVHLRYIEREGVTKDGSSARAYGPESDGVDANAFEERGRGDRHQFRFIVSPEDANELDDLCGFTRELMARVEKDLGTSLDWVAVDHWNTDNPHTHIVLRGKDQRGRDLVIARDYISYGMRARASELATQWLGQRTEREIQESLLREVHQERWTSLDVAIQQRVVNGEIDLRRSSIVAKADSRRQIMVGRLQVLAGMGLAAEPRPGIWTISLRAEEVLRAAGERGDIIRTMQRAMSGRPRPIEIFDGAATKTVVVGRIVDKGLVDEMNERSYLIVDGIDGRAHYITLSARSDTQDLQTGAIVEVRSAQIRRVDETVLAIAEDNIYHVEKHLKRLAAGARQGLDPSEYVAAHVRRLEALRRAGIVERLAEGMWRIPSNLPERGRMYDARNNAGVNVQLLAQLPIERQTQAIGATWLDRRLLDNPSGIAHQGFGAEVRSAMRIRLAFLVEEGLADQRGNRTVLRGNLLATLRQKELLSAGKRLQAETGLAYHEVADGQRIKGVYRRSLILASGRFAVLDDGTGFSLVPWRPVIEKRLGQTLNGVVTGDAVSWDLGRQRGPGM